MVVESGYEFKKGKSRSKYVSSCKVAEKPVRGKINAEVRIKRIKQLEEEVINLDQQIQFKLMRRKDAESAKRYKVCEEITEEILAVSHERNRVHCELSALKQKEKKSLWYMRKRNRSQSTESTSTVSCTSDDSDIPVSPFVSPLLPISTANSVPKPIDASSKSVEDQLQPHF